MNVTIDLILHFLVSRSASPSSMGAQLDRLKYGTNFDVDPVRARDEAENRILEQAGLLRCIDRFAERHEFKQNLTTLEKIQRHTSPPIAQGQIALNILRAYQEWASKSKERGLVAVYHYLATIVPKLVPPPPKSEPDLTHAFRTDKAKRARNLSSEAYADAFLALGSHVKNWNKREVRSRDRTG